MLGRAGILSSEGSASSFYLLTGRLLVVVFNAASLESDGGKRVLVAPGTPADHHRLLVFFALTIVESFDGGGVVSNPSPLSPYFPQRDDLLAWL